MHVAGFVHCDLSLNNTYFVRESDGTVRVRVWRVAIDRLDLQMMLNDFGSAVQIGAAVCKGNMRFLPQDVLAIPENTYYPTPAHDLETFVKVLTVALLPSCDVRRVPYDQVALKDWWARTENRNPSLEAMLRAARSCGYDDLKQKIACLFFSP